MMKKPLVPTLVCSLLLFSLSSYAGIEEQFENSLNISLNKDILVRVKEMRERNELTKTRPAFCPLNNTMSYKKTVESLKSIVTIFKDDCFDNDQALVDDILANSQILEDQLNEIKEEKGEATDSKVSDVKEYEINGISVEKVFSGVSTLFNKNKCSSLDESHLLDKTADMIQTFSQFGLYSPTGVTMAYGGLAVASILRFVNNIFEKRFEFENDADINTFVKLNCSYYDIRNQLQSLEIFDIDTDSHYSDQFEVSELIKVIKGKMDRASKAQINVKKIIENEKKMAIDNTQKELQKIVLPLYKMIEFPLKDLPGKSARYQQAEILGELAFKKDVLASLLVDFTKESQGRDRFLNILYRAKLEELNTAEELMALSVKDFNSSFLKDLASSFKRTLDFIEKKKSDVEKSFLTLKNVQIAGKKVSYKDLLAEYEEKEFKIESEKIKTTLSSVEKVQARIKQVVSNRQYSSKDSDDGGTREIIKSTDTIKNHIYGKYGLKFLDFMRNQSHNQRKNFERKYKAFYENYLSESFIAGEKFSTEKLNEDEILNACVDAQALRGIWIYSQKLSELGYDFISTNNDIFGNPDGNKERKKIKAHARSVILARRIISAQNFSKKIALALEYKLDSVEINGKKILLEKSTNEISKARKVQFDGETYTISEATELLNKKFGSRAFNKRRLGQVMMDVMANRDHTILLQQMYKDYKCDTRGNLDR